MPLFGLKSNKRYVKDRKGSPLSVAQQRAMNFGAILTVSNAEVYDSLRLPAGKKDKKMLEDWWGIFNSEDALETLDLLRGGCHRHEYNVVLSNAAQLMEKTPTFREFVAAYDAADMSIFNKELSKDFPIKTQLARENIELLYAALDDGASQSREDYDVFGSGDSYDICMSLFQSAVDAGALYRGNAESMVSGVPELFDGGFLGDTKADVAEKLAGTNVLAWDMGRMVNVARWCFALGYISEEKVWEYIFHAEKECLKIYKSWADFAAAYTIGRVIWAGSGQSAHVFHTVEMLLNDDESPWRLLGWNDN